ncbi:RDD family protein [Pontibacter sp. MBLB2868]|uniref:RDD family protein n=1 Tax=Pontibacter sp. MBLB2868 TaxID=3451555 RepID=UPI003F75227C
MQALYTQTDKNIELADLSTRIIAFTLDVLLLLTLIGITDYLTFSSNDQAYFFKPERFLHFLLGWIYFAGMETCACQATLGKYLVGLKVTSDDGKRISFKNATIRYFAKPVSLVLILVRFAFGMHHISRKTFHDRLANSQVISR